MIIRIALVFALFYFLFQAVGLEEIAALFAQLRYDYLVLFLLVSPLMIWASCMKWRLFIRASNKANGREQTRDVSLPHLMKLYTIGYFFNTFTPSYIGGDLARSFHLGQYLDSQTDALIATFLERFTGLLAMSLLGFVFLFIGSSVTAGLSLAICSIAALSFVLAAVCFSSKFASFCFGILRKILAYFPKPKFSKLLLSFVDKADTGMQYARSNPALLFKALAWSLFFHCLTVLNTYLAARTISWATPDISGLFVVVPLVLLVSMAPITPSGLGIQEGAFLFLLQRIGASQAQGLGVGLILRVKLLLVGLIGGGLWLALKKSSKTELCSE